MNVLEDLKSYKKELIIGPLLKLIEAILEVLLPITIAKLIDNANNFDNNQILIYGIGLLVLIIIGFLCACVSQYCAAITSQGYGTNLREKMIRKVSKLSDNQIKKVGSSAITNRIINDITNLEVAIAMLIRQVLRVPFVCVGSLIMIYYINLNTGIAVTVALFVLAICIFLIFRYSAKMQRRLNVDIDNLLIRVKESIGNIRLIRSFNTQNYEENKVNQKNTEIKEKALKYNNVSNLLAPTSTVILDIAIIAILILYKINLSNISLGNLIAVINYISRMITAVIMFSNLIIIYSKAFVSSKRIKEVLEMNVDMKFGAEAQMNKSNIAIKFDNVSFSYNENNLLENINLKIDTGEIIGIIGLTGSGKTTLLNLISRKNDVKSGHIEIFGKEIKRYNKRNLKEKIVLIGQKKNFFTDTIENNIKLRKENR